MFCSIRKWTWNTPNKKKMIKGKKFFVIGYGKDQYRHNNILKFYWTITLRKFWDAVYLYLCVCVWCGVCVSIKCIQCDWSSFGCIHRSTLISSSLFERRTTERIQWIPENNTPAINTNILSLYISYMRTFFFSLFKAFFKILNRGTVYTNKQF